MIYRRLKLEEWDKIPNLPPQDHAIVIVAENEQGEIVGRCAAFEAVHMGEMFVEPQYRGSQVAMGLFLQVRDELKALGLKGYVADATSAEVMDYLERLGHDLIGVSYQGRIE